MNLHKEIGFESEICDHLAAKGWHYTSGDAGLYDRARALFPGRSRTLDQCDSTFRLGVTSGKPWFGRIALLLDRVRKQLDNRGTVDVLRNGIELIGVKAPLRLAQFKPALAMNEDILARYNANRLRVIRQVRYSQSNENAIDLVLFVNGVPVATVELKTDFTQSVADAVDQYRFDRIPNSKGRSRSRF